jgi:pimeloyl-ACP methyl ester carboxylesterase
MSSFYPLKKQTKHGETLPAALRQTMGDKVRPFKIHVSEADLEDLKKRLRATRWPDYPNLVYWNRLDRGGHFAAFEQPDLFVKELRACFRKIRAM